jgi:hypothetical protein
VAPAHSEAVSHLPRYALLKARPSPGFGPRHAHCALYSLRDVEQELGSIKTHASAARSMQLTISCRARSGGGEPARSSCHSTEIELVMTGASCSSADKKNRMRCSIDAGETCAQK